MKQSETVFELYGKELFSFENIFVQIMNNFH